MAHENPFDPSSDGFDDAGSLSGVVTDRALDPLAAAGVRVASRGGTVELSFQSTTDAAGTYRFDGIPPGRYTVAVEKDGYAPANDSVDVVVSMPGAVSFSLNGLPAFRQATIRTAHISRVWPPPTDFLLLEASAEVDDLDGLPDIDRVWLEAPSLPAVDTLDFTGEPGIYAKDLTETDLGMASLHDLVGQPMTIHVRDRAGAESVSGPLTVLRIITHTPLVTAPQAGAVTSDPMPELTWVCPAVPFSFTYRIEVVRIDDVVRNTVFRRENLAPAGVCDERGMGRFLLDTPLAIGSYFWTVSIVDAFGNWSRSREAGFVVN